MTFLSVLLLSFIPLNFFGQEKAITDVYLPDISIESDLAIISRNLNISNIGGYDSQPSFLEKNTLVVKNAKNK